MFTRALLCGVAGLALLAGPTFAADNMTVKDASAATVTLRCKDVGSGVQACVYVPFDSSGADMTDTTLHALKASIVSTATQGTKTSPSATAASSVQTDDALNSPAVATTRPATTPTGAAGNLIANNATAGSVVPYTFTSFVRAAGDCNLMPRVILHKSSNSLTNATFAIYWFDAAPTPSVGDGAVFDNAGVLATAGMLHYRGVMTVTMDKSGSDGAAGESLPIHGQGILGCPSSGTTEYALLAEVQPYTVVTGETFTIQPEGFKP